MGTESLWVVAALWVRLALIASLISIRLGISAALVEIEGPYTTLLMSTGLTFDTISALLWADAWR